MLLYGNLQTMSTQLSTKFGQAAPSVWKCPKTQFWGPLTNSNFAKAPPNFDPIANKQTEQTKKLQMDMDLSWHALRSRIQVRTHSHAEKQGFGYRWLNSTHTYWSWAKFQKGQHMRCKISDAFSRLISRLDHKSTCPRLWIKRNRAICWLEASYLNTQN